jgi:hypothetical protein
MIYAAQPFIEDIVYTEGDIAPICLDVYCNGVAYSMQGTQIDIIIEDRHGNIIETLSSVTGEVLISNSELTITPPAFTPNNNYRHFFKQTTGGYIYTIGKGKWIVQKGA